MKCAFRCVKDGIEYNPRFLEGCSQKQIEKLLTIEMVRIFLKHPFSRQPENCSKEALAFGSDCAIYDSYKSQELKGNLCGPDFFKLPHNEYFEWYAQEIDDMLEAEPEPSVDLSQVAIERARDLANGWEEDEMRVAEINDVIEKIGSNWGSLPGDVVEKILASTKARIDYRKIMAGFRAHILSSKTRLTRMKPNRRLDFEQMGSCRKFNTKLLVAVDVSGSISSETLQNFYSVINKFFKYGIDQIDVTQFDYNMEAVTTLNKAKTEIGVFGRGGTCFQPVFDYVEQHPDYDGLVVLTDGMAPHPKVSDKMKAKVLWVCEDENSYNSCKNWMSLLGRVCWMRLK